MFRHDLNVDDILTSILINTKILFWREDILMDNQNGS